MKVKEKGCLLFVKHPQCLHISGGRLIISFEFAFDQQGLNMLLHNVHLDDRLLPTTSNDVQTCSALALIGEKKRNEF